MIIDIIASSSKNEKKKKQTLIAMQGFPDCYTRPKNEVLTILLS